MIEYSLETVCFLAFLRAFESLQEINQSSDRRNQFSEVAMLKLLASNLSVKYSVTGRLASTDITTDGFYDAGPVSVNDTWLDSGNIYYITLRMSKEFLILPAATNSLSYR